MTDEEGPTYKDGDIVWVKLGSCWWPGEVTENGPEDFSAKKPPLAIVKFFNESTYEFVKTHNNIYYYNCERKNEFIKKGMDSFRANNPHMEKFPGDVSLAEIRTDGNPNILAEPQFAPQKKSNIIAEVFGTPSPKKTPKEGKNSRGRVSKNSSKKPKVNITHRRFLGCDDYEAHIRVQFPGKDVENSSGEEEIVKLNAEPSKTFNCSSCSFKTNRIDVMLFHVNCHIKGVDTPKPIKKKTVQKKKKKIIKHITSDDDRTNSSSAFFDSDSEEEKPKKRRRTNPVKKKPQQKIEEEPVADIRSNLLAEWSDSEENDDIETSKEDISKEESFSKNSEVTEEEPKNEETKETSLNKSCFDFEEEDEDEKIVTTTVGRKIPRVIPPNIRKSTEITEPEETFSPNLRKSTEIVEPEESIKSTEIVEPEETIKSSEIVEPEETILPLPEENSNSVSTEPETVKEEEEFKDLMETTSVPELPEIPDIIKPQTNHKTEVATKLTNPKKRFVKSFEDFELLQNEQRKAQEEEEKKGKVVVETVEHKTAESEDEPKVEEIKKVDTNLQISKLKCQIMSKMSDEEPELPKKRTTHRTPRSKILESYRKGEEAVKKEEPVKEETEMKEEQIIEPETVEEKKIEETLVEIEEKKDDVDVEEKKEEVEEIGKMNQIDDYLKDFLFDFQKKSDSPEKIEEVASNEVRIKSDDMDIAIKTNLSNFNKEEEMSALSTLAMVSQFETPTEEKEEDKSESKEDVKMPFVEKTEPELVPIDGNLTVVSEKDLADGQVEITANASPTCKKPVTLTNFSMDFSDCNSSSSSEMKEEPKKEDLLDIEEQIPSQIVEIKPKEKESPPSKLLERLTEKQPPKMIKVPKDSTKMTKKILLKSPPNKIKMTTANKAVILSEKIIKPVVTPVGSVSVQKVTSKRNLHDPDEIDAYIIQKEHKDEEKEESSEAPAKKIKKNTIGMDPKKLQVSSSATSVKKRGKAKILQQTIITPAGEIIQPGVTPPTTTDDQVFDINSMPIVLSDQILTPESIENMPIYLSETPAESPKIIKKPTTTPQMRVLNKSITSTTQKLVKTPKILGSVGTKIIKQNSFGSTGKQKFVIVTQPQTTATTSKYTVGKKIVKSTGTLSKVQNLTPEPSGNKIMILTDQQGQQQRVLLTPAQQKMMGYQNQGKVKTVMKGNIIQKSKEAIPGSSGLISKSMSRINSQTLISSSGHVLTPIQQSKMRPTGRKLQMQSQKVSIKPPQQKTILIKNQHGQTVRRIQGTDDALLDKQVAEQIEAIKASGVLQQKQEVLNYKTNPKTIRRSYVPKKPENPKPTIKTKTEPVVPPLAPISPKKPEPSTENKPERALHQLVIQDAMGNQTTITEGQILALPSETIDGQPQSYMLVTLDESGNLTPLNNEALLSLDPNLGLGGDLANLQIDQEVAAKSEPEPVVAEPEPEPEPEPELPVTKEEKVTTESNPVIQGMTESGQQLIVTGDPIAAQKFLESLTEGNTDLANILASAEGSSILIHADGQQILINTDSDNQMLLSVNTDNLNMTESSEGGGNPIFATQPSKNQDILAAALADTDVFQQDQNSQKVSQLSPNSTLFPMNVSNVLETSLTLNSPIMTPLEVPSTNNKKISDENDILTQVPKNVDLPITITDPNISQTVSQQQAIMASELQTNLELSLPDSGIAATSSEMSYYSLPSLDGSDRSMPILTEDESKEKEEGKAEEDKEFLDESEGLCTLGSEMCSSLSEPPPDMFDLSAVLSSHQLKAEKDKDESNPGSVTETSSPNTMNEDSCEIPVQPEIVTTLKEEEKEVNSTTEVM